VDWQLPLPRDLHGFVLGRDFLNFWNYGREAWNAEAGRFYDIVLYNGELRALTGWDYPTQQWSYPPHLMLLMAPFGLLPYLPAYILWTMLGILTLWWAAPRELKRSHATLALLLAPAGLLTLVCGQNAFFAAAIIAGIFRWLDQRPVLAGLLLGLLTVKPQLGLVFPLMLIMTARWTVFLSAAATTIALAGATALLFGADVWSVYVLIGIPLQEYVIADPTEPIKGMMPTAYMNARLIGLSANVAYAVQACFAAGSLAAVVWTYWRRRDPLLSYAMLVIAGLAATPYLMSYDLAIISWLMLALIASGAVIAPDRPMLLAVVVLPFLAIAGALAGVPASALILPLFGMLVARRMLAIIGRASSAANGLSPQGNTSGGTGYQSFQSSQTTSVAPRSYS
jgi:hypothetical protein